MLTRLLVALSTLTITAAPLQAVQLPPESVALLEVHRANGGSYYIDSAVCDEYDAFGLANLTTRDLHICVSRHRDVDNLTDTVRHEVWHVIQSCNGVQPLFANPMQQLAVADANDWPWQAYDPSRWLIEAEAWNVAREFTEEEIASFYSVYCT
tara:strand:- start:1609 stop:2067 length:459 start_codon:yes stop_codon:yes gene_type:complete